MDYNKVWSLVHKANLSDRAMGKLLDMSGSGFSKMMKNETMTVATLEKIAAHFNLPLLTFFNTQKELSQTNESRVSYGCANCEEKQRRLDELSEKCELQRKLIKEYEKQLGKQGRVNCG